MKKLLTLSLVLVGTISAFAKSTWIMTTECGVQVTVTMAQDDPTVGQITEAWNSANAHSCYHHSYHEHISIQS